MRTDRLHYIDILDRDPIRSVNGLQYQITAADNQWNLKQSADGFPLFRFETRFGDAWTLDYPHNPAIRSELAPQAKPPIKYGTDMWVSFWQKLECPPDPTRTGPSAHLIVSQLHGGYSNRAPIYSMDVISDGFVQHRIIQQTSPTAWDYSPKYIDATANDGSWHHYVKRMRPDTNGDGTGKGELQIWRDGVEILNLSSLAFGYFNDTAPYFKFGIYVKPPTAMGTNICKMANIIGPTRNSLVDLVTAPQPYRAVALSD